MTRRASAECPGCHGVVAGVGRKVTLEQALEHHQKSCPQRGGHKQPTKETEQ